MKDRKTFCKKYNLTEKQFYGEEIIEGSLDLESLTSIPEGFNPTVGGFLDLRSLTSIPEGFNPTVGGSLYLRNALKAQTRALPSTFQSTMREFKLNLELSLSWQNGKYRVFDSIFCEVLKKLKNAFKVKIRGKVAYVVTDGLNFSHGDTIAQAKEGLLYKLSNRDTSAYEGLPLDTIVTKAEAIQMYRVITGACEAGTRYFVENLKEVKDKYTIAELITLTAGQYNSEVFKKFFKGD